MVRYVSFVLAVLVSLSAHALPLEQMLYVGGATPFYNDSDQPDQQKFIEVARRTQLAERMAFVVNTSLRLKTGIAVGFESCGQANAFFSPQRSAVVICSELIELMGQTAASDREFMGKLSRQQFAQVLNGLIWGIYLHELAHAVIAVNHVPVTGREEDVADQFAVWYAANFMDARKVPVILPTIWFWGRLAKGRDLPSMSPDDLRSFMANEHSLDAQRTYNLACWALGTGSASGAQMAAFAGLPSERAERCLDEYAQVDRGMQNHFKKFFKLRPLRGAW